LRLSSLNLDNLFLVDNLGAFSLFSSFPYSLHCYFPSVSYFLQFSTLFTSPPFNYLRLMTFLLSSPLYRLDNLDIFIFFISLLFLHPYSPHISASLHRYSLVISIFFTSLYSLLLYSLTSLLSSHLYTLDISIFISFAIFPYNRVLTSCYYLINYNFVYVYIFENESLLALADIYTAKESIFFTYDFVIHNLVTHNLVTHIFLAFYYLFYHTEFFFFRKQFFCMPPSHPILSPIHLPPT
jgi:hypothetical protein